MTFRARVLLAIVLVVLAVTGAALWITQGAVARSYARTFRARFADDVAALRALQQARLRDVEARCLELAHSVRLLAALDEGDAALLYKIALDELLDVMSPPAGAPSDRRASFFRLIDGAGRVVPPTDRRAGDAPDAPLERAARALAPETAQAVGYLATSGLQETVVTAVVDATDGRRVGALAIGFPAEGAPGLASIRSGVWVEGRLYAPGLDARARGALERLGPATRGGVEVDVAGEPYRWFVRRLPAAPGFPEARFVGLYPLADAVALRRSLRTWIGLAGAVAALVGIALAGVIARGLAEPIRALVAAAGRVRGGDYGVTVAERGADELSRLGAAFNDMVRGLAQRDRYRRILDLVTDREVAERLVAGEVTLGGELRRVSVVFCDICGFTRLTNAMPAPAVVALLNTHMDALTRVVHAHGGVVDKFIGDAVMAVFGAPAAAGDEAARAVAAARGMLAERARLNREGAEPLQVRVGVATGDAVVGCMGASHRLDYTVVGPHVNLAARLCALAQPGQVLIDEATHGAAALGAEAEVLPPVAVKGFDVAVRAYRVQA